MTNGLTFHLLGDVDAAVALLTRAGARGAVLPTGGGLTCMVLKGGDEPRLRLANEGILVRCDYMDECGISLRLYEKSRRQAEVEQPL